MDSSIYTYSYKYGLIYTFSYKYGLIYTYSYKYVDSSILTSINMD